MVHRFPPSISWRCCRDPSQSRERKNYPTMSDVIRKAFHITETGYCQNFQRILLHRFWYPPTFLHRAHLLLPTVAFCRHRSASSLDPSRQTIDWSPASPVPSQRTFFRRSGCELLPTNRFKRRKIELIRNVLDRRQKMWNRFGESEMVN